ncbi:aminomethyltransferase [Desulfacinum hydrothermale DSM 13146]|uniref:Aminomethyltransferase n=1 Tax=Desulfacinum hydrothermale DSM 13146 TaxID=1121390 RepID=A0A1W1XVB3_9BACT|nr:aminomethyltransferase family protein [Desulfacinum hydrothermale]SMC27883.1 aminomethyltransferase [Desulfacinum hydrothermale DSM 13146]
MSLKITPLHDWHVARGAHMADFGGYHMPVWYPTGAKAEHLAVVQAAGLFDTSHMAAVSVQGPDALELLQWTFTKDLERCVGASREPLSKGRCVYGAFLNERGEALDDSIVYRLGDQEFLVVVNAGMGAPVAAHLRDQAGSRSVTIQDLTDRVGKMDIQGPLAAKMLARLLSDPKEAFSGMAYFSFKGHYDPEHPDAAAVTLQDGTPILLSRTGYTGEFGFEIFLAPERLEPLWSALLEAGEKEGLLPCGLAARDSLRAGAVLPLSHQDIGPWPFRHHPWEFALPYNEDKTGFTKDFLGARALLELRTPEYTKAFVGFDLRKLTDPHDAQVLDPDGNVVGTVLTCVTDMAIGRDGDRIYSITSPDKPADFQPRGLSCGFVKLSQDLPAGTPLVLKDRRRSIRVVLTDDIRPHRTARRPIQQMTD